MSSSSRPYRGFSPIDAIKQERVYQERKWGGAPHDRGHTFAEWSLILSREVGEAMECLGRVEWPADRAPDVPYDDKLLDLRSELVQVAAVAVAVIEVVDMLTGPDSLDMPPANVAPSHPAIHLRGCGGMGLPTVDALIPVHNLPFDSLDVSDMNVVDIIIANAERRQRLALAAVRDAILDALVAEAERCRDFVWDPSDTRESDMWDGRADWLRATKDGSS